MTKAEYLKELERQISRIPQKERLDIMSLGTPRSVAQSILMNSLVQEAKASPNVRGRAGALLRIMLLVLVLAPFNFLILVGPFLVLFALLFTGWVTPLAIGAGVTFAGIELLKAGLTGLGVFTGLSIASMWLGTMGLVFLACMLMWLLTRGSLWLLIGFFKWNIDFITQRKN
jgi:uncharacterized membrane protein